jgi:hypothetical protein
MPAAGIAVAMVGSLAREFLVESPYDVLVARVSQIGRGSLVHDGRWLFPASAFVKSDRGVESALRGRRLRQVMLADRAHR